MATTPQQYDGQPIAEAIMDGHYDEDMDVLRAAIRARAETIREHKRIATMAALRKGDAVRVTTGIKPKYLVGLTGTVVRVDQRFAHVRWDDASRIMAGRYVNRDGAIGVPLNCVEKIDEGA